MNNLPKTRTNDVVVQEFENEILIYDLTSNKAFCLNETSAMVWQLCDGRHSVAEISRHLSQKLNQPMTEDLIWLALDQFKRDGLLENNEQFEINFNGLNRRQVIRKIGFASLVALPMIASVVAPSAAQAASGLCQTAADCNDNNACTFSGCNFLTGVCFHRPISCDDGNFCTRDTCDPVTGCMNTPIVCPPGQTCNPTLGCV